MESMNRLSEWASYFPFATWSKEASNKLACNFSLPGNASTSCSSSYGNDNLGASASNLISVGEWVQSFPHASISDYRDPFFTFEFNGTELGLYGMSPMYWAEMMVVCVLRTIDSVNKCFGS